MQTEINTQATKKKIKLDFKDSKYATGRRKKAVARVWMQKGSGLIYVNGFKMIDYFKMLFIYPLCAFIFADYLEWVFPNLQRILLIIKSIIFIYCFLGLLMMVIIMFNNILSASFSN